MQEAHEIVEKFIRPYLAEHHPDAAIVIMAGSYGRAMRQGSYQPIASSDVDLVIIYEDLEKGGLRAACQIFSQEDVGTALGQAPRTMMIDTNIHDLASLHYHDKMVKEHIRIPFINVMLDEGYVLLDKLGIAPVLQEKAAKFLEEGPAPAPREKWAHEIARLETFLADVRAAESTEEKRFLGTMTLLHTCEFALGLNQYWRSGSNQAYRRLTKFLPGDAEKITESFSGIMRRGETESFEILLEDYIRRGKELLPQLPEGSGALPYPVETFVSGSEAGEIRDLFLKFMTDHLCEALETSQKRGEMAYLENLSSTVLFIKTILETRDGAATPTEGREAMRYLGLKMPDIMPVLLQAMDEGIYDPLRHLANEALSHMGGLHYKRLQNYYADDLARVNAMECAGHKQQKTSFKPGFRP